MDVKVVMARTCIGAAFAFALLSHPSFAQTASQTMPKASEAAPTLSASQKDLVHSIEQYILEKTSHLNGDASVHVIFPSKDMPACDVLNISLPNGRNITSRTTFEVTCAGRPEIPMTFVRADIKVEGDYYVPNQVIEINRAISPDMLQTQKGDLLRLPEGTQTDINYLIGRTAAQRLPAGRPIKASSTRGADSVARGQIVQIQINAPGFSVSNQGEAMTSAEVGAPIQVKTAQGKVVRGVVRPGGIVELLM